MKINQCLLAAISLSLFSQFAAAETKELFSGLDFTSPNPQRLFDAAKSTKVQTSTGAQYNVYRWQGNRYYCPTWVATNCTETFGFASTISWSYAIGVSVTAKFSEILSAQVTQTFTYGVANTTSDSFAVPVAKGYSAMATRYIKRQPAWGHFNGAWVKTGKRSQGSGFGYNYTWEIYTWDPNLYVVDYFARETRSVPVNTVVTWKGDGAIPAAYAISD
jgi:hypothetical protein